MSKPPFSMVDVLALRLSEKTGTKFQVVRVKMNTTTKYALSAVMFGNESFLEQYDRMFFAGGVTNRQMTQYLATLCDMVEMGFVPVRKV